MSFIDRRREKFAARQQAVSSVTPNPPKAVNRSGGEETVQQDKPPSPPRRRNEVVEKEPRDTWSKQSRETQTSKDNPAESARISFEPNPQRRRTGEHDSSRDKNKEPMTRSSEVRAPSPSWLRDGF